MGPKPLILVGLAIATVALSLCGCTGGLIQVPSATDTWQAAGSKWLANEQTMISIMALADILHASNTTPEQAATAQAAMGQFTVAIGDAQAALSEPMADGTTGNQAAYRAAQMRALAAFATYASVFAATCPVLHPGQAEGK